MNPSRDPGQSARGKQPDPFSVTTGRANSLGMSKRDLEEFLDDYEAPEAKRQTSGNRQYNRRTFRKLTIPLQLLSPGGGAISMNVACRNVSRTGISVLHSAYVHTGTACTVLLPRVDEKTILVRGKIVRCTHLRGMIHELGINFEQSIDIKMLMKAGPFSDSFSLERVDPAELTGTLLYIDESAADRRLLRHYLRSSNLSITTADSGAAGIARATDGFDLIITEYNLSDLEPGAIIKELRDRSVKTPIIIVTADTVSATPIRANQVSAQAYIAKPMDASMLCRAIAEFLKLGEVGNAALSYMCTLASDHPNAVLVDDYVNDLHDLAKVLDDGVQRNDYKQCWAKSAEVKGTAPALGFAGIAELAEKAMKMMVASSSVEDATMDLRRLVKACELAQVQRAA